ncbi:hypothetical protein F0L68_31945 [Solihabitans fulvus]|uniref:Uncharacterized protein n=1 Tax=Solihabitans fulvus TaxID=1892852 RepID=A0A5B2WTM3_9PSEU|nr:hypothetical protein [Solihabitans fulvus]KAA2253886.1 hypothetical protein F0L68_31945 [Solihabitans fulvus]
MDKRALRILNSAYWGPTGWLKPTADRPPPEDRAYAEQAGYMFPPLAIGHDELIALVRDAADQTTLRAASDAFVASLSTRSLRHRPVLSSFLVARSMPDHTYLHSDYGCQVCGAWPDREVDRSIFNFERHKWGGTRFLEPAFVWFALDRFAHEDQPEPTAEDQRIRRQILSDLADLPPKATATNGERALRAMRSNQDERLGVMEILAIADILQDPAHPGFLNGFVPFAEREDVTARHMDLGYPAGWWRRSHGINATAVDAVFPQP